MEQADYINGLLFKGGRIYVNWYFEIITDRKCFFFFFIAKIQFLKTTDIEDKNGVCTSVLLFYLKDVARYNAIITFYY